MLCFNVCGMHLPVTNMFDMDGDDTTDPKNAVALVVQLPDGMWLSSPCHPSEIHEMAVH